MSQKSDLSQSATFGDYDDDTSSKSCSRSRTARASTSNIESSGTFPFERNIGSNKYPYIFFSFAQKMDKDRNIKLRAASSTKETFITDRNVFIRFKLKSSGCCYSLGIECNPIRRTNRGPNDMDYIYVLCWSTVVETTLGVSNDDRLQIEEDAQLPFKGRTDATIVTHPCSGEPYRDNLKIDHAKIDAATPVRLAFFLISADGEKTKQFEFLLEVCSFPFRVEPCKSFQDYVNGGISENHVMEVIIMTNEQLEQLFQFFSNRGDFLLSVLTLKLEKIDFTENETEKWDKLKCKVERLDVQLKSAESQILKKIFGKIGPVKDLLLAIESYSTYLDSPFQSSMVTLEEIVHFEQLVTIYISDIVAPILMDYFCPTPSGRSARYLMKSVTFSNVSLHFSSLIEVEQFSDAIRRISQQKNFTLELIETTISIGNVDKNAKFVLIVALTTDFHDKEKIPRMVETEITYSEEKNQTQRPQRLRLELAMGFLEKVDVEGILTASSCATSFNLCRNWNFSPTVNHVNCHKLKLQCSQSECTNCSALLFLLAIKRPGRFEESNRRDKGASVKPVEVNFSNKMFSIANLASLARQVQNLEPSLEQKNLSKLTILSVPYLNIDFRCSEPRSGITESLSPSLSILSDSGIEIRALELLVEVDETGWGHIRINPMNREVRVIFTNDVKVTFPLNSLKNVTSIEVHTICASFITECELDENVPASVSPIVSIYQLGSNEFSRYISTEVPLTEKCEEKWKKKRKKKWRESGSAKPRVFSRHPTSSAWKLLQESTQMQSFSNRFQYKSTEAFTVLSLSGIEIDTFPVSDFLEKYFSSFYYVSVYPATQSNTLVLDCVQSTNYFELDQLKINPFFEMKKIEKMGVNDKINGYMHGNVQIESREKETQPNYKHFEFFHPNLKRNRQEVKVDLVDKLLEPMGKITYQMGINETSLSLNFCMPKQESQRMQPTTNMRVCNLSTLKGTLVPSDQTCLLAISYGETNQELHHLLHHRETENLSTGDLVVIVEITGGCSRASFTVRCGRFDEGTKNDISEKCPAFFCVRRLPCIFSKNAN